MKEITLPIPYPATMTLNLNYANPHGLPAADGNGNILVGSIKVDEVKNEIDMARRNGGHVLYAATDVGQRMERIIANDFFGKRPNPPREKIFFQREILEAAILTFHFKKELLKKIVDRRKSFGANGKEKEDFFNALKKIMEWRNAFAHGVLSHDTENGTSLEYYSGEQKSLKLDDAFWNLVMETFAKVIKNLDMLDKKI